MRMDFELTDEQREIRDWVHAFAEKEIRPVAAQYDESEEFPWPVVKKAAEVGADAPDGAETRSANGEHAAATAPAE